MVGFAKESLAGQRTIVEAFLLSLLSQGQACDTDAIVSDSIPGANAVSCAFLEIVEKMPFTATTQIRHLR